LLLLAVAVSVARDAGAGCTRGAEVRALERGLQGAVRCRLKALQDAGRRCGDVVAPSCAGSLPHDAVALAFGSPPPAAVSRTALRPQLACQRAFARAIVSTVGARLRALVAPGSVGAAKAEAKRKKRLDAMTARCAVPVAGSPTGALLPTSGVQCAAAIGGAGTPVDTGALAGCIDTLLRVWTDRVGPDPQPLRPNILLLLTDDQRWDTVDATHSPDGTDIMPGVRRELGGSGVEFPNAFVTTPLCCPSRASMLTGRYARNTGVLSNAGTHGGAPAFDDTSTLATWLEGAGYRTGLIGKYLNGYEDLWLEGAPPYIPPGWTVWQGMRSIRFFNHVFIENGVEVRYGAEEADYLTDVQREKAKAFITDAVEHDQPFFLIVAFKAPHLTAVPAPRHAGRFVGIPAWRPPNFDEADVSDKPGWLRDQLPLAPETVAEIDQTREGQLRLLLAVDEAIGGSEEFGIVGIMATLRDLGIADQTMVMFMSDNGYLWGEHRLERKSLPYEEAIRVPLLVRYPALAPLPRREQGLALNIDLCPTFAELAGITPPYPPDGESLVRLLDGTAPAWRSDFLTEGWPSNHTWATLREARWKYSETLDRAGRIEPELYDLAQDPWELDNVASAPANADRVDAMARRVRELRPGWPTNVTGGVDEDPDE
jgi:arylsulfatase A-like enzyme